MSRGTPGEVAGGGEDKEDEEEEVEEEFYESLDRILSSSFSSPSASDDESSSAPPFASGLDDVWVSEPGPVEERRRRWLQTMGLVGDPAFSRWAGGDGGGGREPEMISRSASCDVASSCRQVVPAAYAAPIARSTSDSAVETSHVKKRGQQRLPLRLNSGDTAECSDSGDQWFEGVKDCEDAEHPRCLIKNLDDGSEFVVKEFHENGMWGKLREVRTGRNFTMEEFELCVGHSPIVRELMRRQSTPNSVDGNNDSARSSSSGSSHRSCPKRRGDWLCSIKNIAASASWHWDVRSSDEIDMSLGCRSSSATDDSQEGQKLSSHLNNRPEKVKVRQHGKSHKDLSGLCLNQEIIAHEGSIWSIKFSPNGQYLASAGEDCVIHVWNVLELEREGHVHADTVQENGCCNSFVTAATNASRRQALVSEHFDTEHCDRKRLSIRMIHRKSVDSLMIRDHIFSLSQKPFCSFHGHQEDVLDLSWSKSLYLLSSSMDKTVRLWQMLSKTCLKTFSHSDFVTCIQFNPVDDRFFISGSLDQKVRIWSIPDRQVVDWTDLHEMVTAACYSQDGKIALVGSHNGSCHMYDTSDNKLLRTNIIDLQNKKKKSNHKKITGFQFVSGSPSKCIISSADSRIRVIDGVTVVQKFKGFRNTGSQISACLSPNGRYMISASEDFNVYCWQYDNDSEQTRTNGTMISTNSFEHFHCQDLTVATVWPSHSRFISEASQTADLGNHDKSGQVSSYPPHSPSMGPPTLGYDRVSATWPEELVSASKPMRKPPEGLLDGRGGGRALTRSAWGLVIVTATHGGHIRVYQNFGFPLQT